MTDLNYILQLAEIENASYKAPDVDVRTIPSGWTPLSQATALNDYNGLAVYNSERRELVIASAGTDGWVDWLYNNTVLIAGSVPPQVGSATSFTKSMMEMAASQGLAVDKVVFVGHSLGGAVAVNLQLKFPGTSAVVFNSAGIGGLPQNLGKAIFGYENLGERDITYVYAETFQPWDIYNAVHNLGAHFSGKYIVVFGASGHEMAPLINGLEKMAAELAESRCFPAHTRIQTSRTTSTAISALRVGDVVLGFDARADKGRGALVPRRVTWAYRNTTTEWIRLRWFDGTAREGVSAPKPCVLDLFGQIPVAPEVARTGGGKRVGRNRPLKRWGERRVDALPVARSGCSTAFR